ncbi:hypothetical protein N3K66_006910 [Trichothecium roseum]|uniref:Uncharacterized protein n=1 Tax=Trichothecium roseum TaxID=47278 RepID=A0ACC0UWL8_9HYPO|nr:hypothetical protein N3K66_006910 [Trichothecium roseum]
MSSEDTTTTTTVNREASFKEQLDQIAVERRKAEQPSQQNPIVEKITEYVPAAAKILGSSANDKPSSEPEKQIPGPPERPHHDHKIEDFVRDQHRSRNEKGEVDLTSAAE